MSTDKSRYGATPDQWAHFSERLGLTEDLFPVVMNPHKNVSPKSKLNIANLGKVPSVYNRAGEIVGIPSWTTKRTTPSQIGHWAAQPDYGICLRTHEVRAFDIDVDDPVHAQAVQDFIEARLGKQLPVRSRPGVGRRALLFRLAGEWGKRTLDVQGGILEILLNGSQVVLAGQHAKSQTHYQWEDGLPESIPEISEAQFKLLWAEMLEAIGTGKHTIAGIGSSYDGEDIERDDDVYDFLVENNWVVGEKSNRSVPIRCPWEDQHTTGETGDTSTVWLMAGAKGFSSGNFKCMHAHCEAKNNSEFFQAVGYNDFWVASDNSPAFPVLARHDKTNKAFATVNNLKAAVMASTFLGAEVRLDAFKQSIMMMEAANEREFEDTDYTTLQLRLESDKHAFRFSSISKEKLRDVVAYVAKEREYDSAQRWLGSLKWDGVERINSFLEDCFGAESSDYHSAISRYFWTALAGRVIDPGVKADMVPVAVGDQGAGKSSTVAAIVPFENAFIELDLGLSDADVARLIRGKLVVELSELKGLQSRAAGHIKQAITRQYEEWIPKYKEMNARYPRRCVFFGTSNEQEFLSDETGNRRWLPFQVGKCNPVFAKSIRDQLWAEAKVAYEIQGVVWQQAERLAADKLDDYFSFDTWFEELNNYLSMSDDVKDFIEFKIDGSSSREILDQIFDIPVKQQDQADKNRVARVMKKLGYRNVSSRGKRFWRKDR